MMMACPARGAASEPDERFCGECGTSLGGGRFRPHRLDAVQSHDVRFRGYRGTSDLAQSEVNRELAATVERLETYGTTGLEIAR
jgi:hypothetical protein